MQQSCKGQEISEEFFLYSNMYIHTLKPPDMFTKSLPYTANVNRQTTDKLLFSYAIITGENV